MPAPPFANTVWDFRARFIEHSKAQSSADFTLFDCFLNMNNP
ncbi:hypothetical protein AOX55_00001597 [Sinorhizobium fredii CCBAU 25509]|nr:hypothetical protein AOX55_00001597 [Sinorhizobium fredii CCBAU 25509]